MSAKDDTEIEAPLPTKEDVLNICNTISSEITKINNLREDDSEMRFRSYTTIIRQLENLKKYEALEHFSDILFDSSLNGKFSYLVSTPNTEISSIFISLMIDICEDSAMVDVVKRHDYLITAITSCIPLDEVNIQTDAQFLYNTFNLISVILDGCEDAQGFSETLLKETEILQLIKRQFQRDDFDENVLAATETLAILLQISPNFISESDSEILHLLLRFVANERNPKNASEEEAAHNGFNAVTLYALNEKGNEELVKMKGIEILMNCWSAEAATAMLAIKAIESALSFSRPCCEQFIEIGGIKKLFSALNKPSTLTSKSMAYRIVGIMDALLTMLSIESTEFKRVIRKFTESNCEKITKFVKISEFVFENVTEVDNDSMGVFQMSACCIAILFGYAPIEVKMHIMEDVSKSESLDFQLIIDSAELRIADVQSIADRVRTGISTIVKIVEHVD